jgi:hypothetical protein
MYCMWGGIRMSGLAWSRQAKQPGGREVVGISSTHAVAYLLRVSAAVRRGLEQAGGMLGRRKSQRYQQRLPCTQPPVGRQHLLRVGAAVRRGMEQAGGMLGRWGSRRYQQQLLSCWAAAPASGRCRCQACFVEHPCYKSATAGQAKMVSVRA